MTESVAGKSKEPAMEAPTEPDCHCNGRRVGNRRAIALALAAAGAHVVMCGRRLDRLETVSTAAATAGGRCLSVQADVSLEADVERLVQAAVQEYGTVDILVNNAGIGGGSYIHKHNVQDWDRVLAVNLRGPFLLSRASPTPHACAAARRNHQHQFESGMEYHPGNGAYGVSKHALNALSRFIQRENQEYGIRVNTICPGWVVTEMAESFTVLDHDKCLQPGDIADLVTWLLTRQPNVKIGRPVLIGTMEDPQA